MNMFGEKSNEYDAIGKREIPVSQMPKYKTGRDAAIKLLKDKDYMSEADFWILKNRTKAGDKMLYSGLIISHNGCLKINDKLPDDQKFKPECVTVNQAGYGGALVFTYVCPEQGIYEVGEVTSKNCKNEYPYAMALKRCFDRVVLKQCKLAFDGVYSDSEAEEFKETPPGPTKEEIESDKNKVDGINAGFAPDAVAMATKEQIKSITAGCEVLGEKVGGILKKNNISSLAQLTEKAAEKLIKALNEKADIKSAEDGV